MWLLACSYLGVVNLLTFAVFAADKRRAALRRRRLPERNLLWLAALGGSAGATAAQHLLRHKTRKEPFRTRLRLIVFAQLAALAALAVYRLM